MESIAVASSDPDTFDPKEKQKAIYLYYDSQYSDEAQDIYSEEWQERILYWHQKAIDSAATTLRSEENLEKLDFGGFFLAHPIPAFSLWQLLQACYELDVAICGNSKGDLDEIESWQKMNPFKYLRDHSVQDKWRASLELFKAQIKAKSEDMDVQEESWELRMHEILIGVEKFETAFESLQENFKANLAGQRFADWMIARIDEDIGKRFSMIHRLLEVKESELAGINPAEENHELGPLDSAALDFHVPFEAPKPNKRWSFKRNRDNPRRPSASEPKLPRPTRTMSIPKSLNLTRGISALKEKFRKPKSTKKLNER
ncbi:hypothetical protein F5882DRAFT_388578 [Hyaloscypha sp. PMI_1271]|nr:hypothetical protein F5882DRAFT_388578 [Hyaloscypha sp. PMI_1271]